MSFEPFVVRCLTCGSQLRVSHAALVGTISQCPKCGSMVQIEPPEQRIAVGREPVDSEAITEESVQNPGPLPASVATGGFDGAPEPQQAEPQQSASAPLDWQSERTARTRQIGLVVAISLCGFLIAAVLFGWFVHSWRQGAAPAVTAAAEVPNDAASAAGPRAPAQRDATDNADSPSPAVANQQAPEAESDAQPAGSPSEPPLGEASAEHGSSPKDVSTGPEDGSTGPAKTETQDANSREPAAPASSTANAASANAPPKIPADLLPDQPPMLALGREKESEVTEASEADTSASGALRELPPGLRKFTPFLDQPGAQPDVKPTLKAPPTLEEIELDQAADDSLDPMMIANPPEPIDLDQALAIQMALDTQGYPLTDFVLLISQLTGVPIQIDWVSFDLAGIDVAGTVTPPGGGWQAAGDLLDAVATSRGAEVRRSESMLELTVGEATFQKKFGSLVRLDDLGDQRKSAIMLLDRFLAGAEQDAEATGPDEEPAADPAAGEDSQARGRDTNEPDKPAAAAGGAEPDESTPEQTPNPDQGSEPAGQDWQPPSGNRQQQQLAALAVDALRRMRGISPKIPDERFRRWAAPAGAAEADWPRLAGGNAGPQYDAPITIAELLRRTARGNQATCLVNWYDVRRRRVSPEQLTLPYTGDAAAEMLERTLDPFGLQVRQVDDQHWWIGSEATYDRLPVLVWTEPLGDQLEPLRSRLDQIMAGASRNVYRFAHDPVSDRALLLLPRFVLSQFDKIRQPGT